MKHFSYLGDKSREEIFFLAPQEISVTAEKETLGMALGASLYMPATRSNIAADIISGKIKGLCTIMICLEDAIGDRELPEANKSFVREMEIIFRALAEGKIRREELPFISVRIRNPQHLRELFAELGEAKEVLGGVVFPKFTPENAPSYFAELDRINEERNHKLYALPILESKEIIHLEQRRASLDRLAEILDKHREKVLNLRIGATDFSALFGIRRNYDITIYDVGVVAGCISDIVNYFSRSERDYIISGPVFEYFSSGEKILKPLLRETPFRRTADKEGQNFRSRLIARHVDTLAREVIMDRANGLWGKTVIHPSHIIPVESLYVVSHEDYLDAQNIVGEQDGVKGVAASSYKSRMNEFKPHYNWASKVLRQAEIFGVFREDKSFSDLLLHEE